MGLAGLPLATLLGIFGAASAVVVVFYILKLRRRAVPVPFSRIWDSVLRDKQATNASLRIACERALAAGEQQERLIASLLTLARGERGLIGGDFAPGR